MRHKTNRSVLLGLFLILSALIETHAQAILTTKQIARTSLPSVVLIICDDGKDIVQGSGFFIKPGVIVTNFHVIEGRMRGLAQVAVGRNRVKMNLRIARVIAVDREADLALLSVPTAIKNSFTHLTLAPESYAPEIGEVVYALGNPEGLVGTISPGIVSAALRSTMKKARLQITAPISHGSSGGPIVNDRGKVIAVAEGSLTDGQSLNFAIPISLVHSLIKTANFPDAVQNSQDAVADNDDKLPAPWVRNGVAGKSGSGKVPRGQADESAAYFYYQGNAFFDKGLLSEAIVAYTKTIQINPKYAVAYYNRGSTYSKQENHRFAIADYTKAIQINPKYADAYYNRGNAYSKQENHRFAIADYTKAIQINPKDAKTYSNRGVVYSKQKNYSFAIADYTKAIQINPDYASAYYNRGIAYAEQENYSFAIADYIKAIQINPEYADAYYNRGYAYSKQENHSFAIADFTKAIQINPEAADAYKSRGNAYCIQGDKIRSNADKKKAVELGESGVRECR